MSAAPAPDKTTVFNILDEVMYEPAVALETAVQMLAQHGHVLEEAGETGKGLLTLVKLRLVLRRLRHEATGGLTRIEARPPRRGGSPTVAGDLLGVVSDGIKALGTLNTKKTPAIPAPSAQLLHMVRGAASRAVGAHIPGPG